MNKMPAGFFGHPFFPLPSVTIIIHCLMESVSVFFQRIQASLKPPSLAIWLVLVPIIMTSRHSPVTRIVFSLNLF